MLHLAREDVSVSDDSAGNVETAEGDAKDEAQLYDKHPFAKLISHSEASGLAFARISRSSMGSETSSGFRSLFRKSPSESTGSQKSNRLSRILKTKKESPSSNSVSPEDTADGKDAKRRQQVYQAQKRHRHRRAEYVKSLEEEVARLQHMDSQVNSEKNTLACQNQMMRELLASHFLDFRLGDSLNLTETPAATTAPASASVEVRWDSDIGHERTFMDIDWSALEKDTPTASKFANTEHMTPSPFTQKESVIGDSWAAVDFILALEWCCQGHMVHAHIHPDATPHKACEELGLQGHALTGTAAVYQGALPSQEGEKWQLPHSEIDKLVKMSENLPLDDEWITPAHAYSAIKDSIPRQSISDPL
ncbi:hypothetical protein AC579_1327 [Pseudocercospora musae]|uniref:BZIP domain-containing protein n=1 Tax=Pseudocercospora musae TaxID=113226 RepID=A0A139IPC9_9PEZI|nr:hypothetical protein AC579_1327 [Pseudocercospora musae]